MRSTGSELQADLLGPPAYRPAASFTRPGSRPVARLGNASLFIQQHEALHYDFNALTTIGNVLALCVQIVERCPDPLRSAAANLANRWSLAQAFLLEGLINYVAYKRAHRRAGPSSLPSIEEMLPGLAVRAHSRWKDAYEDLPLDDHSRDALAMHVGMFVLSVPLYHRLGSVQALAKSDDVVTEELLLTRLETIENALFAADGVERLRSWESQTKELWDRDGSFEDHQIQEAAASHEFLASLAPEVPAFPRSRIVESVQLANDWNQQFEEEGLPAECRVTMASKGYIDTRREVIVGPPSPRLGNLVSCETPEEMISCLDLDPAMHGLGTVFSPTISFQLSERADRTVHPGDLYIRLAIARPTPECDHLDIDSVQRFAIVRRPHASAWLSGLVHERLVLTAAVGSDEVLGEIARISRPPCARLWWIHWDRPLEWAKLRVRIYARRVLWTKVITLHKAQAAFWLVRVDGHPWLDVYPIPWEFTDEVADVASALGAPLHADAEITQSCLFSTTFLMTLYGF